jgi:hypothetical protein
MKTHTLIVTCLVLGSSSAAMAGTSGNAGYHMGPVVRDHRPVTFTASAELHASQIDSRYGRPTGRNDDRYDQPAGRNDDRYGQPADRNDDDRYGRPSRTLPPLTGPTWDCHNWDPAVDGSSVCAAYAPGRSAGPETFGPGILLGVRDAAIPDHQYITVGSGRSFRKIVIEGNGCETEISRVAIKFMDGSVQVVNAYEHLRTGQRLTVNLDGGAREINQIVFYTPSGATGAYAVHAV